jgi:hypothetical protein
MMKVLSCGDQPPNPTMDFRHPPVAGSNLARSEERLKWYGGAIIH